MRYKDDDEFMVAWGKMEALGYQYGDDALENVYVGWVMNEHRLAALQADYDADMKTQHKMFVTQITRLKKIREDLHNARLQIVDLQNNGYKSIFA